MRRWLILFLLTVLPLQFSWAEAASYCAHETSGASAQHFGHHEHHHAASAAADDAASANASGVDLDCGACHAGCALAIVGSVGAVPTLALPTFVQPHPLRMTAPPLSLPDRPNWARLA